MDLSGLTVSMVENWYLNDTDWVAALSALVVAGIYAVAVPRSRKACGLIFVLAGGWWVGYALLTGLLGLYMTPPRSDNWSGGVGLFTARIEFAWHVDAAWRRRLRNIQTAYRTTIKPVRFLLEAR